MRTVSTIEFTQRLLERKAEALQDHRFEDAAAFRDAIARIAAAEAFVDGAARLRETGVAQEAATEARFGGEEESADPAVIAAEEEADRQHLEAFEAYEGLLNAALAARNDP